MGTINRSHQTLRRHRIRQSPHQRAGRLVRFANLSCPTDTLPERLQSLSFTDQKIQGLSRAHRLLNELWAF